MGSVSRRSEAADAAATPRTQVYGLAVEVVEFDGATYYVPDYGRHRYVSRQILKRRYAEADLHELVAKVGATYPGSMIHAGTFFGDMLPSFSKKISGTVYAFEPVLENYVLARTVCEVNALANVVLVHAGLGTYGRIAQIEVGQDNSRGGGSRINREEGDDLPTQPVLLAAIDRLEIEDLVMLQLDVEGWELPVLRGARRTIETHRPVIVLEDYRRNCADYLIELGYSDYGKVAKNTLYLTEERAQELGYT